MPKKGYKMSSESKLKMSLAKLGKPSWNTGKKMKSDWAWNKGVKIDKEKYPKMGHYEKHSEETKKRMSEKKIGRKYEGIKYEERNRKISEAMKTRVVSETTRKKLSEVKMGNKYNLGKKRSLESRKRVSGEKSCNWIKDRTKLKKDRQHAYDYAYKDWMKQVKNRDKWKCRISNEDCSGRLEAHHILPWSRSPELRYEVNNGITLCHYHHPKKREEEQRLAPTFQEMVLRPIYELATK